jgi:hypothetical protein
VEDAAGAAGLPDDYQQVSLVWAQRWGATGCTPVVAAQVDAMVQDLGSYMQTCLAGVITLGVQGDQDAPAASVVV